MAASTICSETVERSVLGTNHVYTLNPCGVAVGDDAYFSIKVIPASLPDFEISWTNESGNVRFIGGNTGRLVHVRGVSPGDAELQVFIGGRWLQVPAFPVKVVEPQPPIKITAWIVSDDENNAARKIEDVQDMIASLNDIYRQVGVSFYLDSVTVTNIPDAYNAFCDAPSTPTATWTFDDIVGIASGTGGLECYFINRFVDTDSVKAAHNRYGIVITTLATENTLAHEIGHALGLRDVYISNQDDKASSDPLLEIAAYEKASELNLPGDWNGGCYGKGTAGTRYYRSGLSMQEVVSRMLMNGVRGSDDCPRDITNGDVRGVYYTRDADMRKVWGKGDVNVAFPWSNRNPTHK